MGSLQLAESMFHSTKLEEVNVEGWDVSVLRNTTNMFYGVKVKSLDLSSWKLKNLSNARAMFRAVRVEEELLLPSQ